MSHICELGGALSDDTHELDAKFSHRRITGFSSDILFAQKPKVLDVVKSCAAERPCDFVLVNIRLHRCLRHALGASFKLGYPKAA